MAPSDAAASGLKTKLCSLLGIELPIVQAPIGSATSPALVSEVSNAGALGMLAMSWLEPASVRRVILETRERTTRPFGVNLGLEWDQEERLGICLEEEIRIVSLFWGDPSPHIARLHEAGALVLHTVRSAEEARRSVEAGVDVVVAQGWESGGHVWGEVATFPLIPVVVDAATPVPVIAAGGIADGRGIAAALALGASGVWMGTRFLASEEAWIDPVYREQVMEAAETDTVYSSVFDGGWPGAPHRAIRNSTVKRWEEAGRPLPGNRPGEGEQVATSAGGRSIDRYSDVLPLPGMSGDLESLALYAGQSAGLVHTVEPAAKIVADLASEAIETIRRLAVVADVEQRAERTD
jgi:NAD(P)H-dependent flavin oxidoreductase YrpB (nitropropane dioxygenase family)